MPSSRKLWFSLDFRPWRKAIVAKEIADVRKAGVRSCKSVSCVIASSNCSCALLRDCSDLVVKKGPSLQVCDIRNSGSASLLLNPHSSDRTNVTFNSSETFRDVTFDREDVAEISIDWSTHTCSSLATSISCTVTRILVADFLTLPQESSLLEARCQSVIYSFVCSFEAETEALAMTRNPLICERTDDQFLS